MALWLVRAIPSPPEPEVSLSSPGAPDSEAVDRDQGGLQVPDFTATVSDSEHTEGTVGGFESESGWQTPGDCNTSGTLESQPDI